MARASLIVGLSTVLTLCGCYAQNKIAQTEPAQAISTSETNETVAATISPALKVQILRLAEDNLSTKADALKTLSRMGSAAIEATPYIIPLLKDNRAFSDDLQPLTKDSDNFFAKDPTFAKQADDGDAHVARRETRSNQRRCMAGS